jgi:predicted 3-demethylubiquinone-9 3-methyltransferase (glyoxalase superfamily)
MTTNPYPCIWCNNNASEVAEFYASVFPGTNFNHANKFVSFVTLSTGTKFMLLNGGPLYTPNNAISFVFECDTQEEIDHYWEIFSSDGGKPLQCGWVTDRYNVSWQVIPKKLGQIMSDPEKFPRAMEAFQKMTKMIIADLENI